MKLLRTIRLDASDTFVFEPAAEPGEWAVSGAFVFWNRDAASFQGKTRSAFRSGFLGVSTLGWSTLVQIVEANEEDRRAVVKSLASQLMTHFGAPTIDDATAAAEEEVTFTEFPLHSAGGHTDRRASVFRRRRSEGIVSHVASAQWTEACTCILLYGGRRRGRAG